MCMYKSNIATEKFRKKNAGKTITVWKVYLSPKDSLELTPPVKSGKEAIYHGIIKSDRRFICHDNRDSHYLEADLGKRGIIVNRGIHVFLTRNNARKYRVENSDESIFKCTAEVNDLVGVNGNTTEAVFMKIHLSEEEAEKGRKRRN